MKNEKNKSNFDFIKYVLQESNKLYLFLTLKENYLQNY